MAVQNFISGSNEVIDEFLDRLGFLKDCSNVDYLPEISRVFLECMFEYWLYKCAECIDNLAKHEIIQVNRNS